MKIDEAIRILETRVAGKTFRGGQTEVPDKDMLRWLKDLKRTRRSLKTTGALINQLSAASFSRK